MEPTSARVLSTPDFYSYAWRSIVGAEQLGGLVVVSWDDGLELACHPYWLLENAVRPGGIDLATRESTVDPAALPSPPPSPQVAVVDGALQVAWPHLDQVDHYHPGWLRHIAERQHLTGSFLPDEEPWDPTTLPEPPTHGNAALHDDEGLRRWLVDLVRYGVARLIDVPTTEHAVAELARRIGPPRETNFGQLWWVRVDIDPNSTANTGLRLPPHTDLPTRETPPGFQLLHCLENSCSGGTSRMTDGLRLTEYLRVEEPDTYEVLTTKRWIFFNRSHEHDHRWTGPLIEVGGLGRPLTLRAFHPVRAFPDMEPADVGRAYEAVRRFSQLAADERFQIGYPFHPGDLVAFDNRRILHARDGFDPAVGTRTLRGCYLDHDEVYSRLRILGRRAADPLTAPGPTPTATEGAARPSRRGSSSGS